MDKSLAIGIVIGAAISSSVSSAFKSVEGKLGDLQKKSESLKIGESYAKRLQALSLHLENHKRKASEAGGGNEKLNRSVEVLAVRLAKAESEARKYGVSLATASKDAVRLGAAIKTTEKQMLSLAAASRRADMRKEIIGSVMETVALGAAMAMPIKKAIDFESAMANVRKVVDGLEDPLEFKKMGNAILDLSTRIPMAASGIAEIMTAAGQAGIARNELLKFAEDAAKMGVAFDMSGKEAGDVMAGLRTIFKLNQDGVVGLGDAYNHLSNNMNATARDILNISNRTGGLARMFGLTGEQLGALSAAFLAMKTRPEVAATGINALLLKLKTADKQSKEFQETLQSLGLTPKILKDAIEKDAQGALLAFLRTVKRAPDVTGTLASLFGAEYSDDIAKLIDGLDEYEKALGLVSSKTQYAGSMQKEFQSRAATTANNLELFKNTLTKLAINIGSVFLPAINSVLTPIGRATDGLANLADRFPMATKVVGGLIIGFIGLKIASVLLRYGFSFVADGAGLVYRMLLMLRASSLAATYALIKQKVATVMLSLAQTRAAAGMALMTAAAAALKIGALVLGTAIGALTAGFHALKVAIISNPIGLALAALFIGATLLITNWTRVKAFMSSLWAGVGAAWQAAISWLGNIVNSIKTGIESSFNAAKTWLYNFSLYDAGARIIGSLWDGIKSAASAPVNAVAKIAGQIRDLLPFSPAKTGPLADLHQVRILETIAEGVSADPLMIKLQEALGMASSLFAGQLQGSVPAMAAAGSSMAGAGIDAPAMSPVGGIVVNVNNTITVNASGEREGVTQLAQRIADETSMQVDRAIRRKYTA